jgi:transcriptional regulator with XRE-family HTH domain
MTTTKTLEQMMQEVSPARRKKVEQRAAQLIAEEMSLRDLRRAHKLTQERIAETLRIGQDQVSRLEQRSDLLISTLRSYIEAMGGTLTLLAEFPHGKPVAVGGLAALHSNLSEPPTHSRASGKERRFAFNVPSKRVHKRGNRAFARRSRSAS